MKVQNFEEFENRILTLDELKRKYPDAIFTMNKNKNFKDKYFVKLEIKTQGDKIEYIGALKGPVSEEEGLKFLNNIVNKNYDKYY